MRLKLTSTQNSVQKIEHIIRSLLELYKIEHTKFAEILIATTEAVNNAIEHGNKCDESKFIYLETQVEDQNMCIRIEDQGCGFCETEVADPTQADRLTEQGGRGIMVMRHLTDDIMFLKNGRVVELRFTLSES